MYFYMIAGSCQQHCRQPSATLLATASNHINQHIKTKESSSVKQMSFLLYIILSIIQPRLACT